MKKLFLSISFLMLVISSYSQGRQNRAKLAFTNQSEILNKATGWSYNSTLGEWIDYENVMSNDKNYKTKYKSLQGRYMMSRKSQNFINIQFKTVSIESKTYYILLVKKWQGRYEYPSISEDWYEWKETFGYIYDQSEYDKISKIDTTGKVTILSTKKVVSLGSAYEKYDETKFLDLIQTEIKSEVKSYATEYKFPIMEATVENEKLIRFYVPARFSKYSNYDFEKEYFEVKPLQFEKLIMK